MPGVREILLVSLLPALVSAIVLIAGLCLARGPSGAWIGPVAIGGGFAAGYFALERPGFRPQDAFNWLAWMTIPITMIGALLAVVRPVRWVYWTTSLLMCAVLIYLLLGPLTKSTWGPMQAVGWIGGAVLVTFVSSLSMGALAARNNSGSNAWILTACAAFSSLVLGMSDSMTFGMIAAALMAACLPLIFLGSRWGRLELGRATPMVFGLLWIGLLMNGHFWSNLEMDKLVGLLIAPQAAWLAELPAINRLKKWQVNLIRVAVVTAVLTGVTIPVATRFYHDTKAFRDEY